MGENRDNSMIQFSYYIDEDTHIIGRKRIPEDISKEEAAKMVKDQKAKYIDREV